VSEVNFEDKLKSAISRGAANRPVDQTALNADTSRATVNEATSTRGDGNNVDIDREMQMLGEANLTYSALTQVMSTRVGILRNVISGR
jgi:flagellar basal-body rod protein FlgB